MKLRCCALVSVLLAAAAISTGRGANPAKGTQQPSGAANQFEQPHPQGLSLVPTRTVEFTTDEGTWMSLDVSPDGKTIIFDLLGHLYMLPIDGGEATPITSGMEFDSQPCFSPDGKRIVFTSDRSGANNVWIASADGSGARPLTNEEQATFTSPAWTSDGKYILVSRKKPAFYNSSFELWMYDVDGGTGIRLLRGKPSPGAPPETWFNALGARASPDGRYVYFSERYGYFQTSPKLPDWQVARLELSTGEKDVITEAVGSAFRPEVSPDGTLLVYGTRYESGTALRVRNLVTGDDRWLKYPVQRDDQESYFSSGDLLPGYAFVPGGRAIVVSYGGKIHRVDLVSGQARLIPFSAKVTRGLGAKLSFPQRVDEGPVRALILQGAGESPDGSQFAFSALTHLYVMSVAGGPPRRLETGALAYQPAWSPDGKWLAYVSWEDEAGYLWKIRADGQGPPQKLTTVSAYYRDPVWSPDGTQIVALRASRYTAMAQPNQWGRDIHGLHIISLPASGGTATVVARGLGYGWPHFNRRGDRIYVTVVERHGPLSAEYSLVSMHLDGSDRHVVFRLKGKDVWGADFSPATQILVNPSGQEALVLYRNQVYLLDTPRTGAEVPTFDLSAPSAAVRQVTDVGADSIGWADAGRTITWSVGASLFRLPLSAVAAGPAETPRASGAAAPENTPESASRYRPQELAVDIEVPRYTPRGTVALRGARLITMRGDEIIPKGDVVIHDNRIVAVGAAGSVPIPAGAKEFDVSGDTIVPGFLDTHAHWFDIRRTVLDLENWDFLASLAYGITTGRDPQTSTSDTFAYESMVDAGVIPGPRAYSTGPGVFYVTDLHSADEAAEVLARYKQYYRTWLIKSYMVGNRMQRQFMVEACRRLGLMPTTEGAGDLALDLTHAIDGFSGAEHQFPIVPLYKDVLELVAKSGISYTPTFIITGYGGPGSENYYFETTDTFHDPKLRRFIPHNVLEQKTTRLFWYRPDEYNYPEAAAAATAILRAGGNVCVGGHGELQGLSFHWELWSLQSGGMTNLEALRTATLNGARAIGLAQDLGSLETGKLADLVVLSKNPLADIRNTTAIRYVMKNGELFDGDTLDEEWPQPKKLPPLWWWNEHP